MATLKTNTLTGTSTAGSIAVTGEGNSTTTNLQQGLAKAFINANQITAADSFNCSGTTDHGTGNYTYTLTNGFSNSNWVLTHEAGHDGVTMGFYIQDATTGRSSTLHRFELKGDGFTNQDSDLIQQAFFGDLA
tara:strand:- start:28 stop:426 length:399 start_codon:yes stop_codon:yes gene_type:complete